MNNLSGSVGDRRLCSPPFCRDFARRAPLSRPVLWVVAPLLLLGLAVAALILSVVHNAVFLALVLALSALVVAFAVRNARGALKDEATLLFLDRFPDSDLRHARDGEVVKVTGWVACGHLSLVSSYEKASRCIYASTVLYEYKGFSAKCLATGCCHWKLVYSERFASDFHLTDVNSGIMVMVKAGHNSKVISLIKENVLVNTTGKSGSLSSTLLKWLRERHLPTEGRFLRLEEGYVKEGSCLTVMGKINRCSGSISISPLLEPVSTGCFLRKFLLPTNVDGLILKLSDNCGPVANPNNPQN